MLTVSNTLRGLQDPVCPNSDFDSTVSEYQTIETPEGSQVVVVKTDYRRQFEGLKASDFSLKSIIDSGSTELLKPMSPIKGNPLEVADVVASELSRFEPLLEQEKEINVESEK